MLEEKDNVLQRYKTTADQTLNSMQKEINHLKSENRRLLTSLYDAAKILLTRFPLRLFPDLRKWDCLVFLGRGYGIELRSMRLQGRMFIRVRELNVEIGNDYKM